MGGVVQRLEALAETLSRSAPHPILGPPSLSVGRIEGGQSVNIVPDWCEIEVDRRLLPGEDAGACLMQVAEALSSLPGGLEGIDFDQPWVHMPALAPSAESWLEPLSVAIAAATGRRPEVRGVPFGTDAGPLHAAGTPCIVVGPGDIAQAHTKDEWIEIEQIEVGAEAYYRIACDLGKVAVGSDR